MSDNNGQTERERSLIREGMKRAIAAGAAAIFMTEEGVRQLFGDMQLPKDLVRYVSDQAADGRQEFLDMLRTEVRRFFDRYEPGQELQKILTDTTVEVNAHIKFHPKSDGKVFPEVVASTVTAERGEKTKSRKKKKKSNKSKKHKSKKSKKQKSKKNKK